MSASRTVVVVLRFFNFPSVLVVPNLVLQPHGDELTVQADTGHDGNGFDDSPVMA